MEEYSGFRGRLDAFTVIGVGTEGETTFTSNLKEYRLKKDSLFIVGPKHILQIQSNNSFKAHVLVISPDFLRRINIDTKHLMPLFLQFGSRHCMELTARMPVSRAPSSRWSNRNSKVPKPTLRSRSSAD
ncbi:MAG: AraC family ligand binding domain-containing protein [Alistipes shahii]|uniref:AraC family ligand binding domain-containing protein n=1 Tax=Alistipes shahii TaxID=328814 RepID=UPI00399D2F3E